MEKFLRGADSTLIYLLVACSFITIWLAGAGWIDISRIKELANMVVGVGIGTGAFSLAKSFRDVSRNAQTISDNKAETVRTEMQLYYRTLLDDLIASGVMTQEQLTAAKAKRQIKQNGEKSV